VLATYVSSLAGDRFARTELHFTAAAPAAAAAVTVTVDHSKKFQKIVGFGGGFTDAAGLNIAKLPKGLQERLVKDYYGADGIEYSTGRIPIGGSDFSTRPYSYDDNVDDEPLSKFALQPEDLNYKIPYMVMAQEVSPHKLKFFGSPWSR
jgi:glucosylceramidase